MAEGARGEVSFDTFYEINECAAFIKDNDLKIVSFMNYLRTIVWMAHILQVALQFPDELLPDAAKFCSKLQVCLGPL